MVCAPFERWSEDGGAAASIAGRLLDLVLHYATADDVVGDKSHSEPEPQQDCPTACAIGWLTFDPAFNQLPPEVRDDIFELARLDNAVLRRALDALLADGNALIASDRDGVAPRVLT